jgi:chitinase
MTEIITKAEFDYLWVQFYNNQGCSVNGPINYNDWRSNIANTPSATAKIFIGVTASPLAATGTESGSQYYLTPDELSSLVRQTVRGRLCVRWRDDVERRLVRLERY